MNALRTILGMLAAIAAVACAPINDTEEELILSAFDQARAGDPALIERLDPQVRTPNASQALQQVHDMIASARSPCERTRTHYSATNVGTVENVTRTVTTRHQYACPNTYLVVDTTLVSTAGSAPLVRSLVVTPVDAAAARTAQTFSFEGKSVREIAFFVMAICSVLLMLIALLGTVFTRGFKRKWLWAIVSLAGIAKFTMIWTTGEIATQALSINLIGFGVTRFIDVLSPWTVSFTLPVGAIVVLSLLWPRWLGHETAEPQP